MTFTTRAIARTLAVAGALALGAPVASASAAVTPGFGAPGYPSLGFPFAGFPAAGALVPGAGVTGTSIGACNRSNGVDGQGLTAGVNNLVCQGAGGAYVAAPTGQISFISTNIGAGVVPTNVVVTAGNGAAGSVTIGAG